MALPSGAPPQTRPASTLLCTPPGGASGPVRSPRPRVPPLPGSSQRPAALPSPARVPRHQAAPAPPPSGGTPPAGLCPRGQAPDCPQGWAGHPTRQWSPSTCCSPAQAEVYTRCLLRRPAAAGGGSAHLAARARSPRRTRQGRPNGTPQVCARTCVHIQVCTCVRPCVYVCACDSVHAGVCAHVGMFMRIRVQCRCVLAHACACASMHVCACIYVCTSVCPCVSMWQCAHRCVCAHRHVHAYMCACVYMCASPHVHACASIRVCVCMHGTERDREQWAAEAAAGQSCHPRSRADRRGPSCLFLRVRVAVPRPRSPSPAGTEAQGGLADGLELNPSA